MKVAKEKWEIGEEKGGGGIRKGETEWGERREVGSEEGKAVQERRQEQKKNGRVQMGWGKDRRESKQGGIDGGNLH